MSNHCLRCKQPIPDDQVTVRGVWAEDAIPSARWGDQTYHAGCFDAAWAERGYPMTAWTSPPVQSPSPARIDWAGIAEAMNLAAGLCHSEANRMEVAHPPTAKHWRDVATQLHAGYLVLGVEARH
jgi:hypothetical protein